MELNHFGVVAGLFRQIGGHSSRFVLFCSFWRLFTIKMIKSVKVFHFLFEKWQQFFLFFYSIKFEPRHKHAKWPPSDLTPWTLTLDQPLDSISEHLLLTFAVWFCLVFCFFSFEACAFGQKFVYFLWSRILQLVQSLFRTTYLFHNIQIDL